MKLDRQYKVAYFSPDNIVASFHTVAECNAYICGRLDESGFPVHYWRVNELECGLWIDYGSHSHFYYILGARISDM